MWRRKVGLALLATALGAVLLPPKVLADSNARIVRLSFVEGDAQLDRRDGRGFEHAFLNMPLTQGTRVLTRDNGLAEVEFEDASTVRLTPGTLIETQSLELRSSGGKYTLVDVQEGTAYFNVRKLSDDDDFRVTVGRRELRLTRASRFRLRVDRAEVSLSVFKGEVEVTGEGGSFTVRKNETVTLDLGDPGRYYLAKGVSGDRYDDWDKEREQYTERYSASASYGGYSPAYSYGVTDLNYWGSYSYISGYGYMWRPYYYPIGWNPFLDGAWYYYPGYGWMWVSAYPWGWMPFRYGGWYYVGGHGWCWRPSHHWHHWNPVVVVHNPPPGHPVPVVRPPALPPASGGGHGPVVVGGGPRPILPPEDPGLRRRGVRDLDIQGKLWKKPAGGDGSDSAGTPGSGPATPPSGGIGNSLVPGSGGGTGSPTVSGGNPTPAPSGRRPVVSRDDVEEAIRDARERRTGSRDANAPVAVSTGTGSSVATPTPVPQDSSAVNPPAGRSRLPEPRQPAARDDFVLSSGSSVSSGSGSSVNPGTQGSSGADPSAGSGRVPESLREPRQQFTSGSSSSGSSTSSGGSSSGWRGSPGGSSAGSGSTSGGSSASSGSSSGGGHGYSGSSGGGSSGSSAAGSGGRPSGGSGGSSSGGGSGSRPSGGGSSGGSRGSSSGHGSGSSSSQSSNPK